MSQQQLFGGEGEHGLAHYRRTAAIEMSIEKYRDRLGSGASPRCLCLGSRTAPAQKRVRMAGGSPTRTGAILTLLAICCPDCSADPRCRPLATHELRITRCFEIKDSVLVVAALLGGRFVFQLNERVPRRLQCVLRCLADAALKAAALTSRGEPMGAKDLVARTIPARHALLRVQAPRSRSRPSARPLTTLPTFS